MSIIQDPKENDGRVSGVGKPISKHLFAASPPVGLWTDTDIDCVYAYIHGTGGIPVIHNLPVHQVHGWKFTS